MGYTHDHKHDTKGRLIVDSLIGKHLKYAHDMPGYEEEEDYARCYAVHDALTTHVPFDEQDEATRKQEVEMARRSAGGKRAKKRLNKNFDWDAQKAKVQRFYARKSVAEAMADVIAFKPRKTWAEIREENGTRVVTITHVMQVEIPLDFEANVFAAEHDGEIPYTAEDWSRLGIAEVLGDGYLSSFEFDRLERQDRPELLMETWDVEEVETEVYTEEDAIKQIG